MRGSSGHDSAKSQDCWGVRIHRGDVGHFPSARNPLRFALKQSQEPTQTCMKELQGHRIHRMRRNTGQTPCGIWLWIVAVVMRTPPRTRSTWNRRFCFLVPETATPKFCSDFSSNGWLYDQMWHDQNVKRIFLTNTLFVSRLLWPLWLREIPARTSPCRSRV